MKKSELINILSSSEEEEVFVVDEDGWEHDIEIEHKDEVFDGFYTAYPACIVIKAKKTD